MASETDHRYDPRWPRDRSLRVGDLDRETIAEILKQRHLEGRIDADEFQFRLDRCLAAKSYAELDELIADFPGADPERGRRPRRRRHPWPLPFAFVPLALICAVVVGAHIAWLAVPLLLFFVVRPLAWRSWRGGWS